MRRGQVKLPGVHRVERKLSGGRHGIYYYRGRYRGAEQLIKFEGENVKDARAKEVAGASALAAAYAAPAKKTPAKVRTVNDLVTMYRAAPDGFLKLREGSTRKTWLPWLDRIRDHFGELPVVALKAKDTRWEVVQWRNQWAQTPRTADYAIQVLQRVLSWSINSGLIDKDCNPAAGIEQLWHANRADVIVEEAELTAILQHTTHHGALAIRLAAATGMRRGDLIDLKWSEVDSISISRVASKSTNGRRITIPLTKDARAVIAELRELNAARDVPSTFVLMSSRGPWQKDGLGSTWWKAAKAAGVDKHFHDLRGTAATRFCRVPQTSDEEVADVMGWDPQRVRAIRKRYVDRERIAKGIIARWEQMEATGA
ncbi:MAG TPA: tyrosine-type recombinase/integrase [Caulobacteraceae bacterium]